MRMPTVGPKTAQRLAFHILFSSAEEARQLSDAISEVKEKIHPCRRCFNLTDTDLCSICRDERRDSRLLCVVSDPRDIAALERTGEFKGRYHVLGGKLSPMEGVGPAELKIQELLERIRKEEIKEVIVATDPDISGEATAMYLSKVIKPLGAKISRLAYGLPIGANIEYADEVTLARAVEGRREI